MSFFIDGPSHNITGMDLVRFAREMMWVFMAINSSHTSVVMVLFRLPLFALCTGPLHDALVLCVVFLD